MERGIKGGKEKEKEWEEVEEEGRWIGDSETSLTRCEFHSDLGISEIATE